MRSEAHYLEHLKARSLILAFDPENPTKGADPRQPPRSLACLELDAKGAERELRRINGTEDREGELDRAREAVKATLEEIEYARSIAGHGKTFVTPPDRQDLLNRQRARVKVLEMESRHLHHIIKVQKKKAERPETTLERRTRELSFKAEGGKLVMFGGRDVFQDADGVDRFRDTPDGETVQQYKARIQARRKAKAKNRRNREEEMQRQLDEIRAEY
jgi:hypothetical protein